MWERFCFYGMRGMLTFFMVNKLMMNEEMANLQYGATQAFVYAFTFFGGLFADKILGLRRSLFWGGLLMIAGSIILAIDPERFFFPGIGFSIIGTGFFKPNISTMVGNLYKEGDHRQDAGFSMFYAGINLGALLGGYLCIVIGKGEMWSSFIPAAYSWNVAFGLAALVMVISLLTFTRTRKNIADIGVSPLLHLAPKKKQLYEYLTYAGTLAVIPLIIYMVSRPEATNLFMLIVGPATLLYIAYEMRSLTKQQNFRITAAVLLMLFSVFFWAFFEQSGGSLSLFAANNLNDQVLGMKLDPNGVNNSANSVFVILFASLIGFLWIGMAKRKIEPNTIVKFGLAFLLLAGGFYLFYYTRFFANAQGITSLDLFTFGWLVISIGEIFLSPIGMSTMTKLSPVRLQAVMMGMWFLASAYGQYFAGLLGADIAKKSESMSLPDRLTVYTDSYKQLALYALIIGVAIIIISPFMKRLMGNVK